MTLEFLSIHPIQLVFSNVYLLETRHGLVLVDAGAPGQHDRILSVLRQIGRDDLKLIFITHAHLDHYGSAAALRHKTGAKIAIHSSDAETMAQGGTDLGQSRGLGRVTSILWPALRYILKPEPVVADLLVEDGQYLDGLGMDARILHTPGHTPGSSCLLFEEGQAFVGDLISTTGKPHVQRNYATDWSAIPGSLVSLAAFRPKRLYPGHGPNLDGAVISSLLS